MATPPRSTAPHHPTPATPAEPHPAPTEPVVHIDEERKRFLLRHAPTIAELATPPAGELAQLVKDGLLKLAGHKLELTDKGKAALDALSGMTGTV